MGSFRSLPLPRRHHRKACGLLHRLLYLDEAGSRWLIRSDPLVERAVGSEQARVRDGQEVVHLASKALRMRRFVRAIEENLTIGSFFRTDFLTSAATIYAEIQQVTVSKIILEML